MIYYSKSICENKIITMPNTRGEKNIASTDPESVLVQ